MAHQYRYPPGMTTATRRLLGTKGALASRNVDTTDVERQILESALIDYIRWSRDHYPPLTDEQVLRVTAALTATEAP